MKKYIRIVLSAEPKIKWDICVDNLSGTGRYIGAAEFRLYLGESLKYVKVVGLGLTEAMMDEMLAAIPVVRSQDYTKATYPIHIASPALVSSLTVA